MWRFAARLPLLPALAVPSPLLAKCAGNEDRDRMQALRRDQLHVRVSSEPSARVGEALFQSRPGERVYTCVYPIRSQGSKSQVLLGLHKRGSCKGKWDGFGGGLEPGESIEECAARELKEECGLRGSLKPSAEVVVLFDSTERTRHHIFVAELESGEPIETEEMAPKWFAVGDLPFEDMWPDLQMWLPQVLRSRGILMHRGYFEIFDGRVTERRLLAPTIAAPGAKLQSIHIELSDAISRQGSSFACSFSGSKQEFDSLWMWAWAMLGAECTQRLLRPPQRSESTADSSNRLHDKQRVEQHWQLKEFGDAQTEFRDRIGNIIAMGYEAIVYGDHGPYIEFKESQICWPMFTHHVLKGPGRVHFEHINSDGSVKLYDQFKAVDNQPNPPPGVYATPNNRPDGFADYRPGLIYVACDEFFTGGGTRSIM